MNPEEITRTITSDRASDTTVEYNKPNKPKYSRFTQQELPACKPILTPRWVITTYIAIGIIFIPMGLATLLASEQVVEIVYRYDEDCLPSKYKKDALAYIRSKKTNKTCIRRLKVPKRMKSPIYVYYQLDKFYQNHRRYVKSKSVNQLRSTKYESDISDCSPEANTTNGPIVPCGLIAWSLFNDTYGFKSRKKALEVSKQDIAWKSDQEYKFGSNVYPKNFQTHGLIGGATLNNSIPLSKQVDLIVWMRTAALPTFRKLYGKIEVDLEAGQNITVTLENNYNTYSFGGKKMLVLSTTSWVGGKNNFIGIGYLTVGGLSLLMAVAFVLVYLINPTPRGSSYLSWDVDPSGHSHRISSIQHQPL